MDKTDILIAGAGVPGLTLGILLAQAGLAVTIVDPASAAPLTPGTRTSALMQGSIDVLTAAGVWDDCRAAGGVMTALTLIDDTAKPLVETTFRAADIGRDYLAVNVPADATLAALRRRAGALPSLTIAHETTLADFTADAFGATARMTDGRAIRAALIVGADGRHSAVRDAAGIGVAETPFGQRALTVLVRHSRPHGGISTEFHRPGGPFTLVPLPDDTSSVVWVDHAEAGHAAQRLSRDAFRAALQDRSGGRLGEIEIVTGPQGWDLCGQRAARLTAPRTALVAEAAHVIHPLGAQGLNLSLRDVAALAVTIREALRLGQDIGGAVTLQRYAAARAGDIALHVAGTESFNRLVSTASPLRRLLRRGGLQAANRLGVLQELTMHGLLAARPVGLRQ